MKNISDIGQNMEQGKWDKLSKSWNTLPAVLNYASWDGFGYPVDQ